MNTLVHFKTHSITLPNEVRLWAETLGDPKNPAMILLNPGAGQCIFWPEEFCRLLSDHFFLIRFDYRDAGLSSPINYQEFPYDLNDLFDDTLAILDHFKIEKAYFVGNSMGGVILQYGAMRAPERMLSMVLMMTSPHHVIPYETLRGVESHYFKLSPPTDTLIEAARATTKQSANVTVFKMRQNLKLKRITAGGEEGYFDQKFWYQIEDTAQKRSKNTPQTQAHFALAQNKHPENRLDQLALVEVPTLIIHGMLDPIFPPDHAQAMAKVMPNAELMLLPHLGHNFDPHFITRFYQAIIKFVERLSSMEKDA